MADVSTEANNSIRRAIANVRRARRDSHLEPMTALLGEMDWMEELQDLLREKNDRSLRQRKSEI